MKGTSHQIIIQSNKQTTEVTVSYMLKKERKVVTVTWNGKRGEGRLQMKTKHSTAQMIRNTKKKSDSGVNGITAL
jgi:hypothetical protein